MRSQLAGGRARVKVQSSRFSLRAYGKRVSRLNGNRICVLNGRLNASQFARRGITNLRIAEIQVKPKHDGIKETVSRYWQANIPHRFSKILEIDFADVHRLGKGGPRVRRQLQCLRAQTPTKFVYRLQ